MKASQKTILLVILAVVDCIVGGGIIIRNSFVKESKQEKNLDAMLEFGQVLHIDEDDLLVYTGLIEEKKAAEKIVYDNMTIEELSVKLERSLNDDLKGKGNLIATYSIEKGVDPYLATAIMLQETGCAWKCSSIVKSCNNVGGQKGKGCGSYSAYPTLDKGIMSFIDGLATNYISKGLTTTKQINRKYAADQTWHQKVDSYITKIKNK